MIILSKKFILLLFLALVLQDCKTDQPQQSNELKTKKNLLKNTKKYDRKNMDIFIKKAIREASKKTSRIRLDSIIQELLLIKQQSFSTVTIGDSLEKYKAILRKEIIKKEKSEIHHYALYDKKNVKLAIFYPDSLKNKTVQSIEIISEKAKTEQGISIGMTFDKALSKHPKKPLKTAVINGCTHVTFNNIKYILDTQNFDIKKLDHSKLRSAKIKSIVID